MAKKVDTRAIAGAFYDSLVGTALDQLHDVAPKLAGVTGNDAGAQIDAALSPQTMPQVRNFLHGLAKEGVLDHIDDIVTAFAAFVSSAAGQALDASVISAVELSEGQQTSIRTDLRKRYGEVAVNFSVDPSLIGGLIIRVGDQVLDNSLRSRLSAIQRNMLAG
ncbi:ATP synthase F1 subunit delta [Candidatus Viridilinea mediisalina]|uniref:ATP synthase subunit delta n=1 Tax=Candidatus Viridilinea mediisalina TaxID=2024553 RepID=A0A2A6RK76_9CHLR|nr:ATP synthase F1 subunit delta [Candidatus Viridilinea mediisalina]PDW03457.1 ATP synthase F1 subunit delta [Candidatus Viridilinea mediisalina]